MLPEWLDVDRLRILSLLLIAIIVFLMFASLRFVTRTAIRISIIVLLFSLGVSAWLYRDSLDDCRSTCSCSLFGFDVDFSRTARLNCEAREP